MTDVDTGVRHGFHNPTGYYVVENGRTYPPKVLIGLAARHAFGRALGPDQFNSGWGPGQALSVLEKLGFTIIPKGGTGRTTYIFTWNPAKWNWSDLDIDLVTFKRRGKIDGGNWSTGNTETLKPGERFVMLKQGNAGRGIFASGVTTGTGSRRNHFDRDRAAIGDRANYVQIRFDRFLDPRRRSNLLDVETLEDQCPHTHWRPAASGTTVKPADIDRLWQLWGEHYAGRGGGDGERLYPDEVVAPREYLEGAIVRVTVNRYERDDDAREKCIECWGTACTVCGVDFADEYGERGEGFIHVHHVVPLSKRRGRYAVDPVRDLMPMCPNCHAIVHRFRPELTPEEMRELPGQNAKLLNAWIRATGRNGSERRQAIAGR